MWSIAKTFTIPTAFLFLSHQALAQPLDCTLGSSETDGNGWCDLPSPTTINADVCLNLEIGGTAQKVLVRILRRAEDPNKAVGILGGPIDVPTNRKVVVKLKKDYTNAIQISVHGGRNPWKRQLGDKNGSADLQAVERVNCVATTK